MKLSHTRIATRSAVFLAGACLQWAAFATDGSNGTWRCGNTYTDQPCQGGRALDLDDPRNSNQKRDADQTTRDARAAADRLERDRLRLESTSARRQASLIDNQPKPAAAKPSRQDNYGVDRLKKGKKDPVYVSGQDPASPPPKKKSSRSAAKS
ncbi:hypothetical protein QTI24_14505 [Variovorax sp. J22P240]|uniref:hypothetical protein n=1 Tax=Variovorax sp. J22P240 TaxID=3053514 RepID=UPI00257893DE|nr:hypothetical protein [Variovorax sp. J22P240]MDL9999828.1 hypothetical protein [Variovorax sp. J22P240]